MQTVSLAHRQFGEKAAGTPLLLLHGLLGSSRNWQSAGRKLGECLPVYALDLRNHGASPHHEQMDYPAMAADVLGWMEGQGFGQVHILGHSMGGKVAMHLACRNPGRFLSLTVVDIAPRAAPPRWGREFALMRQMPVGEFKSRAEAEAWLEPEIRDWAFRKFLVSNLERADAGGFRWIVNLDILHAALPKLFRQVPGDGERYDGPVLYLRGELSKFIHEEDEAMIKAFFPAARLVTVAGAGHNIHFDQTDRFVEIVIEII
jgi:pimeloyl-ACP methyl ester carboxylesterase